MTIRTDTEITLELELSNEVREEVLQALSFAVWGSVLYNYCTTKYANSPFSSNAQDFLELIEKIDSWGLSASGKQEIMDLADRILDYSEVDEVLIF